MARMKLVIYTKAEWTDSKSCREKYNEEGSAPCSLKTLTDMDFYRVIMFW